MLTRIVLYEQKKVKHHQGVSQPDKSTQHKQCIWDQQLHLANKLLVEGMALWLSYLMSSFKPTDPPTTVCKVQAPRLMCTTGIKWSATQCKKSITLVH
jgi:hypothetical protein